MDRPQCSSIRMVLDGTRNDVFRVKWKCTCGAHARVKARYKRDGPVGFKAALETAYSSWLAHRIRRAQNEWTRAERASGRN